MSTQEQRSGLPFGAKAVIGLAFIFGGYFLSVNAEQYLPFQSSLVEMGIPVDLGITIAVIGVFFLLFPAIQFFYLKPLADAINERNSQLERTFGEAESLRAEMTKLRDEYEERIVQTEAEARAQIQQQIREAQEVRQQVMAEASQRAEDLLKQAKEEIDHERHKLFSELQLHVVNMSLAAAEKVVGQNLDTEQNRKLVTEFIEQVEAKN